ncbi:L-histidine N(alpha)-methyltransferase [Moorena sp. SIO3E8]|nr:L-histidine N(alpha)-methyltransferase [Moorena sp. SIO3E8]NEO16739.1 L-histidine N(alpha)-methyltransferase [Moorena sp. SIO3E8]NEQ03274.1 L-histidine N(alpha)-methyltransferase [Moorena sp. SIO3F7]
MIEFDSSLFKEKVKYFFLHIEEETLAAYMYSTPDTTIETDPARGEEYYRQVIEESVDYYLYKEDVRLINKVANQLSNYVPQGGEIIEFGPGPKTAFINKSLPFLKSLNHIKTYIPVDLCKTYLDQAEDVLQDELPDLLVKPIQDDFIENTDLVKQFDKPLVWFKGSTITNLSTNQCVDFLTNISQALPSEGIIIVGVDANQSESSLKKAYDTEKGANFILSVLYCIDRDLPTTNFNPAAFKYQPEWIPNNYCLKHNVIATSNQDFVFDGVNISIKEDEKFHLFSSYKYPVDYFQKIARQAGLEPLTHFVDESQRMVIHVLASKNSVA